MNDKSDYTSKILIFVYHNNVKDIEEKYKISFMAADKSTIHFENKLIPLSDSLSCILVDYSKNDKCPHYICYSEKNADSNKATKKSINSTIIEIELPNASQNPFKFFADKNKYNYQASKALFKFATSKLKTEIRKADDPLLHYLFNIQPNGRILTQTELLDYAKEFIVYLPTLTDCISSNITQEKQENQEKQNFDIEYINFIYFIFRKFWQHQVFGATALMSAMYYQTDKERRESYISEKLKEKISKNNFSFPIDLEFKNMEFAEENLNLISESIITCNNVYLAFLAGYQISLHSKFIEITSEWLMDVDDIDIDQFAEIFAKRVVSTFMGREFYNISQSNREIKQTSNPYLVIEKFTQFSTLFLKGKDEKNVKDALLKFEDGKYFTKSLIESLKFDLNK